MARTRAKSTANTKRGESDPVYEVSGGVAVAEKPESATEPTEVKPSIELPEIDGVKDLEIGDRVQVKTHLTGRTLDDWLEIVEIKPKHLVVIRGDKETHVHKTDVIAIQKFEEWSNASATFEDLRPGDLIQTKIALNSKAPDEWHKVVEIVGKFAAVMVNGRESRIPESNIAAIRKGSDATDEPGELATATPNQLDSLAQEICSLWAEVEQAVDVVARAEQSALETAKLCGEKLIAAKAACPRGQWEQWRETHVVHPTTGKALPSSTATLYQRVAESWDDLTQQECRGLKQAAELLKKPRLSATVAESPELAPVAESRSVKSTDKRMDFYTPEETPLPTPEPRQAEQPKQSEPAAIATPQPPFVGGRRFKTVKYQDTITGQVLESRLVCVVVAINGGSEATKITVRAEDVLEVIG